MKLFICSLVLFTGVSSFAGDQYFICSHILDSEDEEFVVDQVLDSPEVVVNARFQVIGQPHLLYSVQYTHLTHEFKASVMNTRNSKVLDQVTVALEDAKEIHLSQKLYCVVRD